MVERGWWKLVIEGDFETDEADLDHIADMVREGYTEGELVHESEDDGL